NDPEVIPEPRRVSERLPGRNTFKDSLLADAQSLDERLIAVRIGGLKELEQPRALADHHQQAPARGEVLLVDLQMLGQVVDLFRDERDLNLGRSGISLVGGAFGNDSLLSIR